MRRHFLRRIVGVVRCYRGAPCGRLRRHGATTRAPHHYATPLNSYCGVWVTVGAPFTLMLLLMWLSPYETITPLLTVLMPMKLVLLRHKRLRREYGRFGAEQ